MKAAVLALLALSGTVTPTGSGVEAFRYQRALIVPSQAAGSTCVVPDDAVFAHASSQTLGDLGIYREDPAGHIAAVPFSLSINDTQTTESESATVANLHGADGLIDFDLKMPARVHSTVELDLAAKDFMGTAVVSGLTSPTGIRTPLGTFPIFDLSSQHLSRATSLPMQETNFPWLHVQLRLKPRSGSAAIKRDVVRGAYVPPSRQAQRVYSIVAATGDLKQQGQDTIATLHLPEHVPAERVRFLLAPDSDENFDRRIEIVAQPDGSPASASETVEGSISRTTLAPSTGEPMPIDEQAMAVDSAFAANFKTGATVRVVVHNGGQSPLALRAVNIEMRQRKICFNAAASEQYSLLYGMQGDAPGNDEIGSVVSGAGDSTAQLGPEMANPLFVQQQPSKNLLERQPDLLWACSAAVLAILGSVALRRRRMQRL